MTSPVDSRPPLDADLVADALGVGSGWRLEVVAETGSTNAEVGQRYAAGEPAGLVLAAEDQTAGRGRLGREWVVTPRSSLVVSVLLQPPPEVDPTRWAWLPLLTGVATARALERVGTSARLKWPNDVLLEDPAAGAGQELKVGGILLERVERDGSAAAVVGVGLNVHQDRAELPVETATSLALAGASTDRSRLLGHLLAELRGSYDAWAAGADPREDYLALCATVGRGVRVSVPGAAGQGTIEGTATDVDPDGRLVLRTSDGGTERLGAGDVVHVRPADDAAVG